VKVNAGRHGDILSVCGRSCFKQQPSITAN
jgi:hypothetical protein